MKLDLYYLPQNVVRGNPRRVIHSVVMKHPSGGIK